MAKQGKVERLNRILHHEMEAVDAYDAVTAGLDKFSAWKLSLIGADHRGAVAKLRETILAAGAAPEIRPATRHYWPALPARPKDVSAAQDPAILAALQAGERGAIAETVKLLANRRLPDEARTFLEDRLLPTLSGHLDALASLRA